MRVLIVHNNASGFGSDAIFEFQRALVREGDECVLRLVVKDSPDRGAALLEDAEDFDLVVISGGDGTLATMLYVLRKRDVLTCVFPSGTANLFCANLGNTSEPSGLARACRIGRSTLLDLGEIMWVGPGGRKKRQGFSLMAGIGFDATIMQAAVPAKQAMGQAAYFAAAMGNPKPQVCNFNITVDGEEYAAKGISCIVANNTMIQGGIDLVPDSSMTDGLLDVIVLEVDETVQLLRPIFFGLVDREGKKIGRPHLRCFRGKDVRVRCDPPMQIEVDGDPMDDAVSTYRARAIEKSNRLIVDDLSRYSQGDAVAPLFGPTDEMAFPL